MSMTSVDSTRLITDEMLARFDERAATYDRENRFLHEDWAELRDSGYLLAAVPAEFGGAGLGLADVVKLQQRLGYCAAPTAIAVNMHVYWTGVAADLYRAGVESCRWMLEEAAAGEVFAALHGESGNDLPGVYSTSTATRVDGGWKIDAHKIFGSLSPVWTYGGFHAMDSSDPAARRIVHGFVRRNAPGLEIVETWDTLGMRATQSHDTLFHGVFVPDDRCPVVCPSGFAGAGPFLMTAFTWGLCGFAAVYSGAARRAFDLSVEKLPTRRSVALTRTMAHHPEAQHLVADMRIALDAADALLHSTARDWPDGVADPDWPVRLLAMRHFVINQAYEIADRAMDLSGGGAAFKRNRLEQIFRDVRMGRFHPTNTMITHELIGKLCLGIDPDDPQRWG